MTTKERNTLINVILITLVAVFIIGSTVLSQIS